jgi:hypothetical protein
LVGIAGEDDLDAPDLVRAAPTSSTEGREPGGRPLLPNRTAALPNPPRERCLEGLTAQLMDELDN